jgi:hypothetical protein
MFFFVASRIFFKEPQIIQITAIHHISSILYKWFFRAREKNENEKLSLKPSLIFLILQVEALFIDNKRTLQYS